MRRWPLRRLFALCLAVLVTAGLSLSATQVVGMGMEMDMAATPDMAMPGHDCDACGDDAEAAAGGCASICIAPALALLPQLAPTIHGQTADAASPVHRVLPGRGPSPDPHPPRTTDLG